MDKRIVSRLVNDVVTIELPASDSGLTNSDLDMLADALDAAGNMECAAVVLRSGGDDFCRGRSLEPRVERAGPDGPQGIEERNAAPVLRMFAAMGRVPVPVVAVVAGRAWGVGCALAAACDVTIATVGATFCLPEMKRSIPPTLALSALRDLVPYKRLMHFVLTSTVVTANDAVGLGVVSTVVTEESLDETVNEFLKHLRSTERLSLLTVKRYLRSTVRMEGMAAAELASALLAGALASLPQS